MCFQRVMQLDRGREKTFHHRRTFRKGFVDFAFFIEMRFGEVGYIVPDARRRFIAGVLFPNHKGKWLGLDLDGAQCIQTSLLGGAGYGGEFFPVVTDGPLPRAIRNGRFYARNFKSVVQMDAADSGFGPFRAQNHSV